MKKKKGVTLLALVLTIVIMLLLAGIVIQMSLGENGLVAKVIQAQKEQTKAELYDNVKQIYTKLSIEAVRNKKEKPNVEEVFNTDEFKEKYNVVGDNITDKKGEVIDTKELVLEMLKIKYVTPTAENEEEESAPATPEETTPQVVWPKVVAGVTIPEEDKDKTVLKIRIPGAKAKIRFYGDAKIDYGDGNARQVSSETKEFNNGEHVVKISKKGYFALIKVDEDYDVEVLQWGKVEIKNEVLVLTNVLKIYEPEEDKGVVRYSEGKFAEIPEWLFSKKSINTTMSQFYNCKNITSIPENLFATNVNTTDFGSVFLGCTGITSIPENLFRNNVNAKSFSHIFSGCTGLTSIPENLFNHNANVDSFEAAFRECENIRNIPENLFKHNINVKTFFNAFTGCKNITNIPENLFKYNTNVTDFSNVFLGCAGIESIPENLFKNNANTKYFSSAFFGCTGLRSIPENLFKHNVNTTNFGSVFLGCTGLKSIPENLFKHNVNTERFLDTFSGCTGLTSIPENLFRHNVNATNFRYIFSGCTGLRSIPENLFKHNISATDFTSTFSRCNGLTNIPDNIFKYNINVNNFDDVFLQCINIRSIPNQLIEDLKKVKQKGGSVTKSLFGCTSASNYNSLPAYMK